MAGPADDDDDEGGKEEGGSSTFGLGRAEEVEEVAAAVGPEAGVGGGGGGGEVDIELPAAGVASAGGDITGASLSAMTVVEIGLSA